MRNCSSYCLLSINIPILEKIKMSPFDRLYAIMTKPLVFFLYLGLIIALIVHFDLPISTYFFNEDLQTRYHSLDYFTNIGMVGLYFPIFFGFALFFRFIYKSPLWEARFWFLFLCLAISSTICLILKISIGRARPELFFESSKHLYGFYGFKTSDDFWSYPSGHTTVIMSVVLGLCILFPRYFLLFMLLGLAVAFSRVALTIHYLSDVLFTIYLTIIEIGCLLYVLRRKSWLAPAWNHKFTTACRLFRCV